MSGSASIRVLHVDDEPKFADMAAEMLQREDDRLTVETATSASEGLDRLAADDFDCIVSDYDMPRQNGIEFLETVREEYPDLPFILYTGKGSEEVASDAISAGATDYLQKGRGTDQYGLLANRIQNAVEQYRTTRRAAELDRVRTLASNINQALVRAGSRSEAETRVCEIITESDPYLFAWVAEVESETDRLEPRAWAGVEEGYLDDITVTADGTATGQGPGGTAVRDRRIAVSQNVQEDPDFEAWRDDALERGYQAVAAIPLEYEDTLYGVLGVYSERPYAFDDDERELLTELGDDLAHAVHSFEVQEQLRTERDRRQALFENAPGPVIAAEIHEGGDILMTDINEAFEEVFGYEAEEVVGQGPPELIIPEDRRDQYEQLRGRAVAGDTIVTEVERVTVDGLRTFLLHVIPYGVDETHADGLYAWYTEITERKQHEQELQREREFINQALDALDDLFYVVGTDGTLRRWNDRVAEVTGYTDEELATMQATGLFPPDDQEVVAGKIEETLTTGDAVVEADVLTADGDRIPYEFTGSRLTDASGEVRGVIGIGRDISDRKAREQKVTSLHAVADDLTASESVEQACERTIEASEEILAFDVSVISIESGGTLPPVAASEGVSPDGMTTMTVDEGITGKTYRTGDSFLINDLTRRDDANPQGPYKSAISVPIGDYGVFQAVAETPGAFDDTDLELAELLVNHTESALDRLTHEQQLHRQNERLDKFASVVSHDLRNPLNVAQGRLELAREEFESPHLVDAAEAVDRSLSLIDDLLTLAREGGQVTETESVDLAELLDDCWQTVETAEATLVSETTLTMQADPSRLKQLLENLFRNAVEHGGGEVTVTVGDLADRNGFYVADDGPGIPPDERDDVFEAGYSTSDEGTGFGLNIVREIVDAHDWEITVTDSESGGARFEVADLTSSHP